jgi:signal transduction histidine kinase
VRIPLRVRVFGLIAAIEIALFGVGLYFLALKIEREREASSAEFSELLVYTLQTTITTGNELGVASILRWPNWRYFDDAIIVRASFDEGPRGELVPRGAYLNPIGRARRRADFAEQAILRDITEVVRSRDPRPSAGGVALPILGPGGEVWGGCWFVLAGRPDAAELALQLLPWFLLSLLLLTLGTFSVLQRFFLMPVQELAAGAQRVSAGDLAARVRVPARRDEMADLIAGFNAMTARVQGFNAELAREVEAATARVRRAEAAAMMQRRLAATGELAAGIAHEINNPLGGLINAADALERGNLSPDKRTQYQGLLRTGLERIRATVGQLLRFTPRTTRQGPVAIAEPVLDALALVEHRARAQGVLLVLSSGDLAARGDEGREEVVARWRSLPPVLGQANELAQAVLNLLVNALDALEEDPRTGERGGRVEVSVAGRAGELELSVADDGPGVPAEDLPRISDLFFTTKEVGKGSGLGLAIVHNVVHQHGGRLELSSEPGRGFRATIHLPLWTPEVRA